MSRRLTLESLEPRRVLAAGTWTALVHAAPSGVGTMELLSDGTVIGTSGKNWYKLTPDANGSFVNGAWSTMASMSTERLYDATNVLRDGRIFVVGGEYSGPNLTANWTNTGEIYNPVTNSWSSIPNFPQSGFGDDPSMVLPDGRVLCGYLSGPQTYIYDPATNSWSNGPTKLYGDRSDEETWTKLPDGSILSYDIFSNPQHAQRMDPATMTWIDSGSVPVNLSGGDSELGPAVLLPDGRVFQIGSNGNTALYTPSTTPGGTGTWIAGPTLPTGFGANDGPAAMMPNGHVLLAAGGVPGWNSPTKIFEYDPIANSIADVTPTNPNLSGNVVFTARMLMLPSGQVLFDTGSSQLYVYTPSGAPQSAWKPTITSVVANGDHFTLTGTQLNGISAGASYGDDAEMDTNYPIIQLKSTAGKVYYAPTFNWSSTGVATGSAPITTDFSLPANMPNGTYSLSVIANGIASSSVSFSGGIVGAAADLIVTNSGPANSTEGSNLTFNLTVTNNGPTNTTNVVLTDTLDPNLKYVSATNSQGTFTQSGSKVTFSLGSIAVGATVTATVTAQSLDVGNLTDSATATSSLSDANPFNNTAAVIVPVIDPPIAVSGPLTTSSQTLANQTVATFTHAGGIELVGAFLATINWGDAKTSIGAITKSGSTYSVIGSHTYAASGTYTITTAVVEPVPVAPPTAWTPLTNLATSIARLVLLSDGSVFDPHAASGIGGERLIPDTMGSYINGTWSKAAGFALTSRNGDSQLVLPDGRLFLFGGLHNSVTPLNDGQIYDPVADVWTNVANFPAGSMFGNAPMVLLSDGRVLAGAMDGPVTYIYDPGTDAWTAGPTKLYGDNSSHETWTKLADGSVLSYDVNANPGEAQRLDPTTMQWVDAGAVPVALEGGISASLNLGPGVLLPDGRVLQFGRSSNTAIYTPPTTDDGTNGAGTWTAGPVIPNGLEAGGDNDADGSTATMLPNGHVLFCADQPDSGGPTRFFEFDPSAPLATSLTDVTPANGVYADNSANYATRMLLLPTGQVLLGNGNPFGQLGGTNQLYVYTPTGAPQSTWRPTITSLVANGNHYTLTGTQLNGLSTGGSHGTSTSLATNYPLVELANGSGQVYFARTSNWSSTGVATGSTPISTDFSLPAVMPYGAYSLTVVANGIASDPVPFTGGTVGRFADLVVLNSGPLTGTEGDTVTYNLTVTNTGPYSAPNVVLSDSLDANLAYLSATKSQGTFSRSGSVVTFSFGSLGVGQSVTATITAQATEDGNLNNAASVTEGILDPVSANNSAFATTAFAEPQLIVSSPIALSGKKQSNATVAAFTHSNGVEAVGSFIATINWGDGTTSAGTISKSGSTYSVKGSHTYAGNGTFTVATTVVENETPKPGSSRSIGLLNAILVSSPTSGHASIAGIISSALHSDSTAAGKIVSLLSIAPGNGFTNLVLVDHLLADLENADTSGTAGDWQNALDDLLVLMGELG